MIVHLPTPHDHFSPQTGSAVMTVIDGLARASGSRQAVLISKGTYQDRYDSAVVIEYDAGAWVNPRQQRIDGLGARLGAGRPFRDRTYRRAVVALPAGPSTLLLHNAPFAGALTPSRARAVLYAHNDVLPGPRWAVSRAVAGTDGVIAVSTWLADRLESRLPRGRRGRIAALLNGVDTSAFPVVRREDRDTVRILFLGRVVPDKGPDLLLDALARLGTKPFQVRIVGSEGFSASGPTSEYEKSLRKRAARIRRPVEFVPFTERSGVPEHFAWADIVVLPARWHEPCGLTLLEAMSTGAATVISESGGMPEVAGDASLVVPRSDISALEDALVALIEDANLRRALGERARARAEALSWDTRTRELDRILKSWGLPPD